MNLCAKDLRNLKEPCHLDLIYGHISSLKPQSCPKSGIPSGTGLSQSSTPCI
jgi:hypothetical protein